MKKVLNGFLAGAVVGVGATVAVEKFLESDSGKKTSKIAQKMFSDFYDFVSPQLKMIKKMGRAKYKQIVMSAAEEYGKMRELSGEAINGLIDKTLSMWEDFTGKDDET